MRRREAKGRDKTLIISHVDGDGICSAAIVLKKYPSSEVVFARPNTLAEKLEKVLEKPPQRVFILDLSPSDPRVRELIRELAKKTKVMAIDHHPNPMADRWFIWSRSKSTAQLTSEVILYDPYLSNLGAYCDGYLFNNEYRIDAKLLYYTLKLFNDDFREYVARKLSEGLKVSQIPGLIEKARLGEEKIKRTLISAKRCEIVTTHLLSVLFLNEARGFGSIIAQKLANKRRKIVVLMHKNDEKIGFSIRKHKSIPIDLGEMARRICTQIEGEGGGHPGAAGGGIPSNRKKEFIELITKYLKSRGFG